MSRALLPYRPDAAGPAEPLLRRADVAPLTWTGMLLDGALVPVWGSVAARSDAVVTPAMRLAAVADLVPHRGVVGRRCAVWVHAGGPPPERVEVLVGPGTRRTDPHPARRAAQGPLPDGDVLDLGTGRVTTVWRTGLDVARYEPADEAARLLVRLLPLGFDPVAALAALDAMAGGRGVRRARGVMVALRRG